MYFIATARQSVTWTKVQVLDSLLFTVYVTKQVPYNTFFTNSTCTFIIDLMQFTGISGEKAARKWHCLYGWQWTMSDDGQKRRLGTNRSITLCWALEINRSPLSSYTGMQLTKHTALILYSDWWKHNVRGLSKWAIALSHTHIYI